MFSFFFSLFVLIRSLLTVFLSLFNFLMSVVVFLYWLFSFCCRLFGVFVSFVVLFFCFVSVVLGFLNIFWCRFFVISNNLSLNGFFVCLNLSFSSFMSFLSSFNRFFVRINFSLIGLLLSFCFDLVGCFLVLFSCLNLCFRFFSIFVWNIM